jgi:hypothetical protein
MASGAREASPPSRLSGGHAPDCRRGRDGYRPHVGALDAGDRRTITRPCGRDNVVVEADIRGCVDTIEHDGWMRMWGARLEEGAVRRLIRTWLRAGVLDPAGPVLPPGTGRPHGGLIAPIRAPVSRHEALDRWVHNGVTPRGGGAACLMRDADELVGAVQDQAAAERVSREWGPRLGQFGRAWSPDQTRVIPCTRQQGPGHTSVDCLGVACRWGRDRAGTPHRKRRPARQKRRHARKRVTDWCTQHGRARRKDRCREVHAKVRGDDHDDGVPGHAASRQAFCTGVRRLLCKGLHRRRPRWR